MTSSRCRFALAGLGLLCASCAASGPPPEDLLPGQRPSNESLEAGLWMQMERTEEALRTSGKVVDDPALTAYVRGIVCKLEPQFCSDIRVYVVQAAGFNATMAPNGMMSVWTGLILRAENEAQLAFVLGHELTHYIKRHAVQRWQEVRAKTDSLVFFQVATAMMGVGIIGSVAGIATYGSLLAFSRDHEREADRGGLDILAKAGYDPREASKIWAQLIAEKDAGDDEDTPLFFSTHPTGEERLETLADLAGQLEVPEAETGRERFLAATAGFRGEWLRDELRGRSFAGFHVLLDRLTDSGADSGQIAFYRGETYRLQGGEEEREKAIAAYREALRYPDAPPETYRSLGLVFWSMKRSEDAHQAFNSYLAARPDADDLEMIRYYLERTP